VPLALVVAGANRNDFKLLRATLERLVVKRPRPTRAAPQGLCLDKGYDYREVYALLAELRFTAHVRARGEEAAAPRTRGHRARRWVVERTHSWTNRFRALLVRWEKKVANYLASLQLACAYTCFQRAGLLR
jgi:putative transposase